MHACQTKAMPRSIYICIRELYKGLHAKRLRSTYELVRELATFTRTDSSLGLLQRTVRVARLI